MKSGQSKDRLNIIRTVKNPSFKNNTSKIMFYSSNNKLRSVITTKVVTLPLGSFVKDAITLMTENNIGCILIIDPNCKPAGIITERDILRFYKKYKVLNKIKVENVMTSPVKTLPMNVDIYNGTVYLDKYKFRRIAIVDNDGKILGLVTQKDVIRKQNEEFKKEIYERKKIETKLVKHRLRLEELVEKRTKELSLLLETTIKTSQILDFKKILQIFSQILIKSSFHHTCCRIAILDKTRQHFEINAATTMRFLELDSTIGKKYSLDNFEFLKKTISKCDIRIVNHKSVFLNEVEREFLFQNFFQSVLILPFIEKNDLIGFALVDEARKPSRTDFSSENIKYYKTLINYLSVSIKNALLFSSNKRLFLHMIEALSAAIDARDNYTHYHSKNVTRYAIEIAKGMNIPNGQISTIKTAGLLHDIGKIGIKDEILLKPGRLTSEEFDEVKKHPIKAVKILGAVEELEGIITEIIIAHHERYDGSGYPHGLKGEEIPLGARIIAVADAFDAMTTKRIYRDNLGKKKAIEEIKKGSGTQFDPQVAEVFLNIVAFRLSPLGQQL